MFTWNSLQTKDYYPVKIADWNHKIMNKLLALNTWSHIIVGKLFILGIFYMICVQNTIANSSGTITQKQCIYKRPRYTIPKPLGIE